jgi:hypothetical protein
VLAGVEDEAETEAEAEEEVERPVAGREPAAAASSS